MLSSSRNRKDSHRGNYFDYCCNSFLQKHYTAVVYSLSHRVKSNLLSSLETILMTLDVYGKSPLILPKELLLGSKTMSLMWSQDQQYSAATTTGFLYMMGRTRMGDELVHTVEME